VKGLLSTVCLLLIACGQVHAADLAIRGVTVVDVTGGSLISDQTVLIQGNRIVAVGPVDTIRVAHDTDVVEAQGRYLIPGLWDMHVHSLFRMPGDLGEGAIFNAEWHFPLFLAHGVTGIRDMNDGTGDPTLELTNTVRRRLAEGDLPGPARFLASGPSIDGDPPLPNNPAVVRTAAEGRAVVDTLADHGADLVKVYENLSREAYFAIMDQAQRRGLPVDGHVPFRVTPEEAANAGQRTVEHPEALAVGCSTRADAARDEFERVLADFDNLPQGERFLAQFRFYRAIYDSRDPAACRSAFEAFRQSGVAVAADLVAYHHIVHADEILADEASMSLVPAAIRRNWQESFDAGTFQEFQSILRPVIPLELENVRLFHEGGGTLLAATDVGVPLQIPGISLHRQLARLVEAGLTPLEALRTATLNPARALGLAESLGSIEAGKFADLVLLDANPLEDIRNTRKIRAVVADGRPYRRAELEQLLAEFATVDQPPTATTTVGSDHANCLPDTTLSERLQFAGIDQARDILGSSDAWARQLSVFDRGARQRTLEPTNTRDFLEFVSGAAAAWTDDEMLYWQSLVDQLGKAMEGLNLVLPDAWMVKTTGLEEFNAIYVRNQSIVFPRWRVDLPRDAPRDIFLLAHELFHMLSSEDPSWRDELYALLGFRRFPGLEFPAELEDRRLSNPMYGARHEYALTVQTDSGPVDVTPVYQAAVPLGEFIAIAEGPPRAVLEAIDFVLLPVDTCTGTVLRDDRGNPVVYRFEDTDWVDQMQRNTSYIIHPDELLADNFALLMEWRRSGKIPEAVPGGPGKGFRLNDLELLREIEKVLTAGCEGSNDP
jgi:imidazolonepropionase-like amidohydrolase